MYRVHVCVCVFEREREEEEPQVYGQQENNGGMSHPIFSHKSFMLCT